MLVVKLVVALVAAYVLFRGGLFFVKAFATPAPSPPPEGEMRRVKITYRCTICGLEIRTTKAATDSPEPPRHCMEDMDLVEAADL